jgi:hypothetical protein
VGKTTVARAVVARLPNTILFDPEIIGIGLQRLATLARPSSPVQDFQDLVAWRRLTVAGLRLARWRSPNVIVPMAISNPAYLEQLRQGVSRFDERVLHYCLVAPVNVVHSRLKYRGADPTRDSWQFRRASECCQAHRSGTFAVQVDTSRRTPESIASILIDVVKASSSALPNTR